MGYAGIQTMLLTYKMRKADKEFELAQISQKLTEAVSEKGDISNELAAAKAELSEDDPEYGDKATAYDQQFEKELEDVAAWEDELEQQQSNCQTTISQLDGYINSWEKALQTNIQKAHSYGPAASG